MFGVDSSSERINELTPARFTIYILIGRNCIQLRYEIKIRILDVISIAT